LRRHVGTAPVFENSTANVLRCREPRVGAGFGLLAARGFQPRRQSRLSSRRWRWPLSS